jgi:exopolysaccharide biosynthesis polyprenyl glycosylphosphotransferase
MNSKNYNVSHHEKQVLIAGVPCISEKFLHNVRKENIEFNVAGYVGINDNRMVRGVEHIGRLEDMEDILKHMVVDEVIFTVTRDYLTEIEKHVLLCERMGITARILLDTNELRLAKADLKNVGRMPMLTFYTVPMNPVTLFLKRVTDIAGATIGLILTSVCSIAIIPAIKLDSPGPVLFTQNRVGLNGRRFKLYKFRSMYIDAEQRKQALSEQNEISSVHMFKMKNDPRITRIGAFLRKTSLDELPQFINVLKGDMSLVGTRPPTVDEVMHYKTHHFRRLSIRPGITGLWQVSGRSSITDFEEVVRLDTRYIDEWSLWLDIKILLKTLTSVINKKSAY